MSGIYPVHHIPDPTQAYCRCTARKIANNKGLLYCPVCDLHPVSTCETCRRAAK